MAPARVITWRGRCLSAQGKRSPMQSTAMSLPLPTTGFRRVLQSRIEAPLACGRKLPSPVNASTWAGSRSISTLERARSQAKDMGFDGVDVYEPWLPVDLGQQVLMALHGVVGDGAAAVAISALLLRIMTLPWHLRSLKKQCDRVALLPVYMGLAKAMEKARRARGGADGSGPRGAQNAEADLVRLQTQFTDFAQSTHFSPVQGMGYQFMCMMPLHILSYFCLRGIMAHPDAFRSIIDQPTLWLDSVVFADPYGVLPMMSACAMLLNAEVNAPPPQAGQEDNAVYMKLVVRGALLTFVPITVLLPSSIAIFMGTNAIYTGLITWTFRRWLWIPPRIEERWLVPESARIVWNQDASAASASQLSSSISPPTPPPPPKTSRPNRWLWLGALMPALRPAGMYSRGTSKEVRL